MPREDAGPAAEEFIMGLDLLPDFQKSSGQSSLARGLATAGSLIAYHFLSMIPLYGYGSPTRGWLVTAGNEDGKALSVIRTLTMIPDTFYEKIISATGLIHMPTAPRDRDKFLRGLKIAVLVANCLVRQPLILASSPDPALIPLVSAGKLVYTRFFAGVSSLLCGLLFMGLESFVDAYTLPQTAKTLWQTADLTTTLVTHGRCPSSYRGWMELSVVMMGVVMTLYANSILSWQMVASRGDSRQVRPYTCIEQFKNAEINHKIVTNYLKTNVLDRFYSALVGTLRFGVRLAVGAKPHHSMLTWCDRLEGLLPRDPLILVTKPPYKLNGVTSLKPVYSILLVQRALYYFILIPFFIWLSAEFSADQYHPERVVAGYLSKGYRVQGHTHYGTAANHVAEKITQLTNYTMWFIPVEFTMDCFFVFGKVDASSIMGLLSKINLLCDTLYEK